QALLDALAQAGFERLGSELRAAVGAAGDGFADRLRATAGAYIHFATEDADLLELMFAGKNRDPTGALNEAAERAFAVMLDLITQGQGNGALQRGDPERVGLVLFATIQGIAALVTAGMVDPDQVDALAAVAAQVIPSGRIGGDDRRLAQLPQTVVEHARRDPAAARLELAEGQRLLVAQFPQHAQRPAASEQIEHRHHRPPGARPPHRLTGQRCRL